jgi:hypothetical protein
MLKSEFWKLIDDSRHEAGGNPKAHLAAFKSALNDLEPNELISFGHWFDDYYDRADTWELRGAAHLIKGGCTDDGFLGFKGWLISRGEKVFEAALAKPDALAKVVGPGEGCEADGFAFAAQMAWARKTGKGVDEFPASPLGPGKGGIGGTPWDEAALPKLLPKLRKKFAR